MRKFFALALAVAMVLSLASVSFAADTDAVELSGSYRYDADKNKMINPAKDNLDADDDPTDALRYGSGVYYLIKLDEDDNDDYMPANRYKAIEKLKVKAEFEMGEDLVESVSIVKKYVDKDNCDGLYILTNGGITKSGFYYFVEFKIAKKETTSESDVIATLEFDRKADDEVETDEGTGIRKIKDEKWDAEFTVFYNNNWNINGTIESDGREHLEWDTDYALKFNDDGEVELSFGNDKDGDNEGTFTVDVSGQGKVYLRYNTTANEAIANANPGVDMHFINFNNVKFNRVGEFVYEMDDIAAAYQVVGDKLVEIKGLQVDTDEVSFYTRLLGSYVFATEELVNPVVEAPVVEAPAATNPSTGF